MTLKHHDQHPNSILPSSELVTPSGHLQIQQCAQSMFSNRVAGPRAFVLIDLLSLAGIMTQS